MRVIAMFTVGGDGDACTTGVLEQIADSIAEFVLVHDESGNELLPGEIQVAEVLALPTLLDKIEKEIRDGEPPTAVQ